MKFTPAEAVLTVDAGLVARALPFRAYGDLRHYLNCICIEPEKKGGVNVVATDGHTLICLHDPNGSAPRRMLLPIAKGQRTALRKGGTLHATAEGRAYIADADGQCLWISPENELTGKYPDSRAALGNVDDYQPGFIGAIDPNLLDRVRAAQKPGGRYSQPIRLFQRPCAGPNSTIAATFGTDGFALLMPMRMDDNQGLLADAVPLSYRIAKPVQAAAA